MFDPRQEEAIKSAQAKTNEIWQQLMELYGKGQERYNEEASKAPDGSPKHQAAIQIAEQAAMCAQYCRDRIG